MGRLEYYMPVLAMLVLQFTYAVLALITRLALLHGLSPPVLVFYRHAIATTVISPIAYFSRRKSGSCSLNLRSFTLLFLSALIGLVQNQRKRMEGGLRVYVPAMAMIGLQFHYAVLAIFTRAALLHGMNTRVFVVYRQAIATLAMAPFALSSNRRQSFKASLGLKSMSLMFATALIGVTANQNAYFEGLHLSSSTVTTAMSNLIPAVTFILALFFGLEKIDVRSLRSLAKIAGTVLCVGGAITMALLKGQKLLHLQFLLSKQALGISDGDHWLLGCAFLLASSIFWSFWMIMQIPVSSSCPDHVVSTFWMCLMAAIQSAIFTLVVEKDSQAWILNSSLEYSSCLYAGIGIAVSFFIQSWTISKRGPLFCAMFNPLSTVITAIVSATFLHEDLYVGSLIGGLAVISGLYIVLWGKAKEVEGVKREAQLNNQDDRISCKTDLEEALLSPHVSESKITP